MKDCLKREIIPGDIVAYLGRDREIHCGKVICVYEDRITVKRADRVNGEYKLRKRKACVPSSYSVVVLTDSADNILIGREKYNDLQRLFASQ